MLTTSFIGSDKNAGKTTAMNFVSDKLCQNSQRICLTSIGVNGESVDNYEGHQKPNIIVKSETLFITKVNHLKKRKGLYLIIENLMPPIFDEQFVLAKAIFTFDVILEGPNSRTGIIAMKEILKNLQICDQLLIDGSIDRQFIAHPEVSDSFYFSLLISSRKEQIKKARDLMAPLSFAKCEDQLSNEIKKRLKNDNKSLILTNNFEQLYQGDTIPFLDESLKDLILKNINKPLNLYLNGALSESLVKFLSPLKKITIILDNFTLYQNISTKREHEFKFNPKVVLLHPVNIESIFIRESSRLLQIDSPNHILIHNLFREDINEIRI